MRPSQHPSETHNSDEWISVADLMAGLLMLFALLVIATLVQLKQIEEQNRNKRVLVIQALQEQFNANKISAKINPETGDITLLDSILFVVGKSKLTDDGIKFLEEFIPVYGKTLFKDSQISDEITRIIIEGHTSSEGGVSHNMSLSLARAESVYQFIEGNMWRTTQATPPLGDGHTWVETWVDTFPEQPEFMEKIQISGRGMLDSNKDMPKDEDRKVLFRMQFKSDEAFKMFLK